MGWIADFMVTSILLAGLFGFALGRGHGPTLFKALLIPFSCEHHSWALVRRDKRLSCPWDFIVLPGHASRASHSEINSAGSRR